MECEYHISPDAEEFIEERLYEQRIRGKVDEIRAGDVGANLDDDPHVDTDPN